MGFSISNNFPCNSYSSLYGQISEERGALMINYIMYLPMVILISIPMLYHCYKFRGLENMVLYIIIAGGGRNLSGNYRCDIWWVRIHRAYYLNLCSSSWSWVDSKYLYCNALIIIYFIRREISH